MCNTTTFVIIAVSVVVIPDRIVQLTPILPVASQNYGNLCLVHLLYVYWIADTAAEEVYLMKKTVLQGFV